jgi:two-component system, chemotaxis family, response regulator Rcp1
MPLSVVSVTPFVSPRQEAQQIMDFISGKFALTHVLLVEDSDGDVRLTREALWEVNPSVCLHTAKDGVDAMIFLRQRGSHTSAPRPDLILLDLNMPKMDGREVLAEIKQDRHLKTIPIAILTTSEAAEDIAKSYQLQANCYLTKPVEWGHFKNLVNSINDFWLTRATLPPHAHSAARPLL